MGAFSNVDYELQNNEAAVSNAFMEDDDIVPLTIAAQRESYWETYIAV